MVQVNLSISSCSNIEYESEEMYANVSSFLSVYIVLSLM